jgi:hypothetical protein
VDCELQSVSWDVERHEVGANAALVKSLRKTARS